MPRDSRGYLTKYVVTNLTRDNWLSMSETKQEAIELRDQDTTGICQHVECWQYEPTPTGDHLLFKTLID